jgi:putative FmdB family regulatory protein
MSCRSVPARRSGAGGRVKNSGGTGVLFLDSRVGEMPIYEYQCGNCGELSEFIVDGALREQPVTCRVCGSEDMRRVLSRNVIGRSRGPSGGRTCCGRQERCERPPCTTEERCRR